MQMNHILITEDNQEAFSDVLPPRLSGRDRITIGAYDDDGAVCGAVSMTQASDRMDLDWIFVMPQVRRRGIGSGLVAELSDYALQAEGRPLYCSFAADEDEGNGLYLFFVSDALSDCGFDVSYAYDRYIITPEALKKLKTDHVKTGSGVFQLNLFAAIWRSAGRAEERKGKRRGVSEGGNQREAQVCA